MTISTGIGNLYKRPDLNLSVSRNQKTKGGEQTMPDATGVFPEKLLDIDASSIAKIESSPLGLEVINRAGVRKSLIGRIGAKKVARYFTDGQWLEFVPDIWSLPFAKPRTALTLNASANFGATLSSSGKYLVLASGYDGIVVYKIVDDVVVSTQSVAMGNPPNSTMRGTLPNWDPTDTYLTAIPNGTYTGDIRVYKRSGDTVTQLVSLNSSPAIPTDSAWHPAEGSYLAYTLNTTACVKVYKRTGDSFAALPDLPSSPGQPANGVRWSPDGNYLLVTTGTTPYLHIWKKTGDTFTKLATPSVIPNAIASRLDISPNGNWVAVLTSSAPFIYIYRMADGALERVASTLALPSLGYAVAWSPDSKRLAVNVRNSPFYVILKRELNTFSYEELPASIAVNGDNSSMSLFWARNYALVVGAANQLKVIKPAGQYYGGVPEQID